MRALHKFYWWLCGFLSSVLLVAGAAAIAIFAVPVGTYFQNNDELIAQELQQLNLYTLIAQFGDVRVEQLPFIKKALQDFWDQNDLDKYAIVHWDEFDQLAFKDLTNAGEALEKAIEVTATIDSLDLAPQFGELATLPVFNNFDQLSQEALDAIDETSNDFIPELYYYKTSDTPTYARVYGRDGVKVPEAEGKDYYYPALKNVNILDLFKVLPDRLGQEKARNIFALAGEVEEGSLVDVILQDYAVNEMGTLTPEQISKELKLDYFMPVKDNEIFYDVIVDALSYKGDREDITLFDINGNLDLDKIRIQSVLGDDEATDLFDILLDAVDREGATKENLIIGDLRHINMDNIRIVTVVPYKDEGGNYINTDFYDLIRGATNAMSDEELEKVTLQDISGIEIDNILLKTVLDPAESRDIYDLLIAAVEIKEGDDRTELTDDNIKIGDIQHFKIDKIPFHHFITSADNDVLAKVLVDATNKDYNDIVVGDLKGDGFNIYNIHLASLIDEGTMGDISKVLLDLSHKTSYADLIIDDLKHMQLDELHLAKVITNPDAKMKDFLEQATNESWENITLAMLENGTLATDNVKLTAFIPVEGNEKLYDCLRESLPGISSNDEITIGALNGGFDLNNVHLGTVMTESENPIIQALIDKNATLGNLGAVVDGITLYDVYGKDCFVQRSVVSYTGDKYRMEVNEAGKTSYVYDPTLANEEAYYLRADASIWSLLCFDVTDKDATNGRGKTYEVNETTFAELEGNAAGESLQNATVYQLIASGLLTDQGYSDTVKSYSIPEILNLVEMIP